MDEYETKLQTQRRQRIERSGAYPIHSQEEALAFLDNVALCRFTHHGEVELPCFIDALAEEVREEYWGWKDSLPNTRRVYYGTIFHFHKRDAVRPGFLALRVLTACYALSPVMQFGGERALLPRWTGLSREALNLAEALDQRGSLATSALRKTTGLAGKEHNNLFHKALTEAQGNFLIVRTGVTSTSRGNYGYIWESFPRAYPSVAAQAESMPENAAAEAILRAYVDIAVAVTPERVAEVLALDPSLLRRAGERLVEQGSLAQEAEGALRAP